MCSFRSSSSRSDFDMRPPIFNEYSATREVPTLFDTDADDQTMLRCERLGVPSKVFNVTNEVRLTRENNLAAFRAEDMNVIFVGDFGIPTASPLCQCSFTTQKQFCHEVETAFTPPSEFSKAAVSGLVLRFQAFHLASRPRPSGVSPNLVDRVLIIFSPRRVPKTMTEVDPKPSATALGI